MSTNKFICQIKENEQAEKKTKHASKPTTRLLKHRHDVDL